MARRLTVVLVGAAMAALMLGMAGAARALRPTSTCTGDIVLDAGHGGDGEGASYTFPDDTKIYEKDQNLEVANLLKGLLQDGNGPYYKVCMTRGGGFDADATLSNRDRYTFANTTGAKLLVSIHMNGSSDHTIDYTTTLFGKWQKDKALAYALFGDNVNPPKINPPTYGLRTLSAVNGRGTTWGTIAARDPYSYASGVLLKSNMPATIAETVFITNKQEAEWLKTGISPDGSKVSRQQQIAEALEQGINKYYATIQ